jgi:uncharacterized protein YktA (UPF0223 family)
VYDIVNESKRSEIPDDLFGVPEQRKFPLDTKEHVKSAVRFFNYVEKKYEKELAANIIEKIKAYDLEDEIHTSEKNRFSKYFPEKEMEEKAVERINDEGKPVPEVCPECGSKVGLFLRGEPVWVCSNKKCNKYFGTLPFKKESTEDIIIDIYEKYLNDDLNDTEFLAMLERVED